MQHGARTQEESQLPSHLTSCENIKSQSKPVMNSVSTSLRPTCWTFCQHCNCILHHVVSEWVGGCGSVQTSDAVGPNTSCCKNRLQPRHSLIGCFPSYTTPSNDNKTSPQQVSQLRQQQLAGAKCKNLPSKNVEKVTVQDTGVKSCL
jgi:hypothetical protein